MRKYNNEDLEVFNNWRDSLPEGKIGGSGIPKGFVFGYDKDQAFAVGECILIFPVGVGCIILKPDGIWEGDIAPFSD